MNPADTPLSPAQQEELAALAKAQAGRVMQRIPALGAVAWLMMQQPGLRHTLLSELDWRVLPPLVLDQSRLYLREHAPLAFVSWARLSDEAAARFRAPPHHLSIADWASGDAIWIVDLIAPFGGTREIMADLREKHFADAPVHQLAPDGKGGATPIIWPAVAKK